ncbi:MAG: ABC transporter substrate-binding protein [Rhodovarius sp.]|nr:ABC transporter substrate-binding protein [Rhodovarius sp.]MDW8315756.1 ABC transporter substrate-binding protein [Rhodovarius sp.]
MLRTTRRLLPSLLAAPALAQGAGELRLLALLPERGPAAVVGDETWRGLELAVAESPAAGRLRLLRADAAEPAAAVAELRRVAGLAGERPAAVFGSVASSVALAASQAADALGILFLELNATEEAIIERGLRQVWRLGPGASAFAEVLLEGLSGPIAQVSGLPAALRRFAILSDGSLSAESLAQAAEARLAAAGMPPVLRFSAPAAEMPGAVQRLRAVAADTVVHAGAEQDIAALFRAFREAGWRPPLLVGLSGGHGVADTARAAGDGHDGTWVVEAPPVPAGHPFQEAYRRRFGAAPRSAHSFAAFSLGWAALAALLAPDPREALAQLDLPVGALPNGWGLRFDQRQQNQRARPVLARWEGGALSLP